MNAKRFMLTMFGFLTLHIVQLMIMLRLLRVENTLTLM